MTLVSIPTFEYDGITVITSSQRGLWASSSEDISPHRRETFGYNVTDEFISCDMRSKAEGTSVSIDLITYNNSQISSYVYVCSKKCLLLPLGAEVGGRHDDIILVLDQHWDLPAAW